ncbi:MAG: hypothetical protein H8E44_46700 [Planctomycetes bacterium]|nr:hypothetical protein [Planctomycetota bacterium]
MFRKIGEAIQLLGAHFPLFAAIVLTIWLPANALLCHLTYNVWADDEGLAVMRAAMWIEGIFGPIYLGALMYALSEIKQKRPVGYAKAMEAGFRNWGRLFVANFVAGLIIVVGLIALVIPGIYLSLRYALLDSVVILEGADAGEARRRSGELTKGIMLKIMGTWLVCYVAILFCTVAIYVPIGVAQEMGALGDTASMIVEVCVDCVADVMFLVVPIAMFLYYWEKREQESGSEKLTGKDVYESEGSFFEKADLGDLEDDGNPYRPPQA